MSQTKFWASINNQVLPVSGLPEHTLVSFFEDLRNQITIAEHIQVPAKLPYEDIKFYRLKHPTLVDIDEQSNDYEDVPDHVKQACLEDTNRVRVNPFTTKVGSLAPKILPDHVYLVVNFPYAFRDTNNAIRALRQSHGALFECLQVTVKEYNDWGPHDVQRNLRGGVHTMNADILPPEFGQIQEALARKRKYQPDHEQQTGFLLARDHCPIEFARVFAPAGTEPHTVVLDREFVTLWSVLKVYHSGVARMISSDACPALRAIGFSVHFIHPPFLFNDYDSFGFQAQESWGFPIFVDTVEARNNWRKLTPKNDWMAVSRSHGIPFVISEVKSQVNESDRCRLLIQAIALACAGQFLMKHDSKGKFFAVAIYLSSALVASRYIVMQSGGNDKAVCIHQKDFHLTDKDEEVDFVREMYNLTTEIVALSGDLDELKQATMNDVEAIAQKVLSVISVHTATQTDSISDGPQDEDSLGVFESEEIQSLLCKLNSKVEYIPFGHPHLALIMNKADNSLGYLKFVQYDREVDTLSYLMQIESPANHIVSGVRLWPVQERTVISMPVAGAWLTSLNNPDEQLWSVALQLFEAVAFMHEHNVAHMDLKPQNVLIPVEGGRLSIIDFSVSIRVSGPDARYSGVVGTEAYMSPEVHHGKYKPMLADLWSCGRTLEELCLCCRPSADRMKLLKIARQLMNLDPEARPRMSTVLEWIAPTGRNGNTNATSSSFSPAASSLCA